MAALGVALFPCRCDNRDEIVPYVHSLSAAAMFLILAYFCYLFYQRALEKGYPQAKARGVIYAICGIVMLASILVLAIDAFTDGSLSAKVARLTFYGERAALMAFGISWLTASRVIPVLTREDERFNPLTDKAAK